MPTPGTSTKEQGLDERVRPLRGANRAARWAQGKPVTALGGHARFDALAPVAARPGIVTLVGAGPGDPELLTLKAVKALQAAQIVLHDSLIDPAVFEHVPRGAHRIAVGKRAGRHSMSQRAIIELMLRLARGGHPVLRLKGGDPFIFGRGGEEVLALARAGIPFEVIPGVSAAQGAAACAGIPLTHRDHAGALVFATGHVRGGDDDAGVPDLDWALLTRPRQTTVIYMGLAALPQICGQLVAHGLPPDTPAAVVERATCPDQRTIAGTVATLPALAQAHRASAPALIVIGAVAALQRTLGAAMRPHAQAA